MSFVVRLVYPYYLSLTVGRCFFLKGKADCRVYIEDEWDKLIVDDSSHYVESMPKRVAACILAKGGHTKW
jgi:hypothetical protein